MISLRANLPAKLSAMLDRPAIHRASAWLGLLGFMTGKSPCFFLEDLVRGSNRASGLTSFLVIRMWFGKAVEDFNNAITKGGTDAPQLIAQLSNGFTSTFFFPPASILPTFSHCSGMGGLCVLCSPCHLCFGPTTRCGRWQVIQKCLVIKCRTILQAQVLSGQFLFLQAPYHTLN